MEVEIVEFYKAEGGSKGFIGTLHVYLPDLDIDLRGCPVFKKKDKYLIHLPGKQYIDESGKAKRYPIVGFTKHETYDGLVKELNKVGNDFMKALVA
jgi:hypothetical protein